MAAGEKDDVQRIFRNRALAKRIEEAFAFELGFELLESEFECALADGREGMGVELIATARGVDADSAGGEEFHAVGGFEFHLRGGVLEHDAVETGRCVFEGEVEMAGGAVEVDVGKLAAHEDGRREIGFERLFDQRGDLGDAQCRGIFWEIALGGVELFVDVEEAGHRRSVTVRAGNGNKDGRKDRKEAKITKNSSDRQTVIPSAWSVAICAFIASYSSSVMVASRG